MYRSSKLVEQAVPVKNCGPQAWAVLLLTLSCVGFIGCSKQEMAQVAGRIVFAEDNTAAAELSGYRVSFLCHRDQPDGKSRRVTATGLVGEDGTFTMNTYEMGDGVLLGTHQVAITPPVLLSEEVLTRKPIILPRFGNPAQSGLTAVVDGDTEVVLEVQRAE